MRGVVGAVTLRGSGGTYVIRIECKDEEAYRLLVRKMRLIGIFVTREKHD